MTKLNVKIQLKIEGNDKVIKQIKDNPEKFIDFDVYHNITKKKMIIEVPLIG